MEELVFKSEKGTPITTSLLVAKKFGKEHKNVIRDIENLTAQNLAVKKLFREATYFSERNREYPMYLMNRDGFTLLVMGFTGADALKFKLDFIDAFNKMEDAIKSSGFQVPTSFREALLLAAQQQEQIEAQEKQLTLQAPKVQYYDEVLQSQGLIAANVIAKELGMSAVTLNRKLNEKGVIYRCSGTWVFYHRYQDRGYGKLKTHPYVDSHGVQRTAESLYYTESGRAFIHQIMKSCA